MSRAYEDTSSFGKYEYFGSEDASQAGGPGAMPLNTAAPSVLETLEEGEIERQATDWMWDIASSVGECVCQASAVRATQSWSLGDAVSLV